MTRKSSLHGSRRASSARRSMGIAKNYSAIINNAHRLADLGNEDYMLDNFQNFSSREDLERLLAEGQTENTSIEFKNSAALTRNKSDFEEMCRDVTAFANAGGGQVFYGIGEDKKAKKYFVDTGVEDPVITREWIDQKLASNVNPSMQGVRISEFPVSDKGRAFVLTIPPTSNGPHQSPDHKYYRRSETHRPSMTDREIRDVIARSTTPDLDVELTFEGTTSRTPAWPVNRND
ncbi:MAG: ATP-binding protein [Alphaproteobacteria bacterium]|nr:ATP-binding protein [Alphaproteobacteria bacterium]